MSSSPWSVDIHAFVSQGFIYTTDNNYLAQSERGSAEFSEIGLNVTKSVTDRLRIGAQLFARDLGPDGNYKPQFDWYYLDYRLFDWLGVRAGRTKIPFGLYNEYNDIDAARVPILLPQSMYPSDNREILLAQTGGELYGNVPMGPVGQLEYRVYGGTIFADRPNRPNNAYTVTDVRVPYVFGGRLMWFTPLEGLTLAASGQAVRLDSDFQFRPEVTKVLVDNMLAPSTFTGAAKFDLPVKLWVVSLEYARGDLLISAEYSRRIAHTESTVPLLPSDYIVNERYYGMVSYHLLSWFTPGAYYSAYYLNVDETRKGRENHQHDAALTLRFDILDNWIFKVEGHLMRGTAALTRELNNDVELKSLRENWGALLLKTTAYF